MIKITLAAFAILLPLLAGCATLTHGTQQQINVQTIPSGAECRVGPIVITSPGVVMVERGSGDYQKVICEMPGYEPGEASLTRSSSRSLWGNVLFGVIPGLLTDFATGADGEYSPSVVTLHLVKR